MIVRCGLALKDHGRPRTLKGLVAAPLGAVPSHGPSGPGQRRSLSQSWGAPDSERLVDARGIAR